MTPPEPPESPPPPPTSPPRQAPLEAPPPQPRSIPPREDFCEVCDSGLIVEEDELFCVFCDAPRQGKLAQESPPPAIPLEPVPASEPVPSVPVGPVLGPHLPPQSELTFPKKVPLPYLAPVSPDFWKLHFADITELAHEVETLASRGENLDPPPNSRNAVYRLLHEMVVSKKTLSSFLKIAWTGHPTGLVSLARLLQDGHLVIHHDRWGEDLVAVQDELVAAIAAQRGLLVSERDEFRAEAAKEGRWFLAGTEIRRTFDGGSFVLIIGPEPEPWTQDLHHEAARRRGRFMGGSLFLGIGIAAIVALWATFAIQEFIEQSNSTLITETVFLLIIAAGGLGYGIYRVITNPPPTEPPAPPPAPY